MRRVKANTDWSLFCPNEAPGLADCWGEEFEQLYERYEKEGRAKKVVKAQKLWFTILESQTETGTPYMLYKDACNRKSNQQVCVCVLLFLPYLPLSLSQNLGTIKCSNLCTEIVEYSSPDEVRLHLLCVCVCVFYQYKYQYDGSVYSFSVCVCRWQCATWRLLP